MDFVGNNKWTFLFCIEDKNLLPKIASDIAIFGLNGTQIRNQLWNLGVKSELIYFLVHTVIRLYCLCLSVYSFYMKCCITYYNNNYIWTSHGRQLQRQDAQTSNYRIIYEDFTYKVSGHASGYQCNLNDSVCKPQFPSLRFLFRTATDPFNVCILI